MFYTVNYRRRLTVSLAAQPELEPGRAYRTRELRRWGANPARLARRLVREGLLRQAAHGLFYAPIVSRFGPSPPGQTELLRAFFGDSAFLISGPPKWNALGLGSTAVFAMTLVYNEKRSAEHIFDGRRYLLRRVLFPEDAPPEYFVIDLLQHHGMAGISLADLERSLVATLTEGRWNQALLREMALGYGTKATQTLVERSCREASAAS
jgi:hypothetical protein